MKRLTAILLTLALLFCIGGAFAANPTPGDVDREFRNGFPYIAWKQTSRGTGMRSEYYEEARIKGHDYSFRVMGNGYGIAEISLSGWFADLRMNNDATFPDGLHAYNNFLHASYDAIPDGYDADAFYSAYDIWTVMRNGRPFTTVSGNWRVTACSKQVLEAVHRDGAYIIFSVNGSRFNITIHP